jgi:hypothetical protein
MISCLRISRWLDLWAAGRVQRPIRVDVLWFLRRVEGTIGVDLRLSLLRLAGW